MHSNINIETQIRSLTKLLDDLRQGIIQVPPFQRNFVWERDDIKDLFDSIRNNYPIGSILLWKPKTKQPWDTLKKVGSFELPIDNEQKIYLLDGYQRMSSLFGCLTNPQKLGLVYDENEYSVFYNLYFDLEDEVFIYLRHSNPLPYQVPVHILMSTSDFRQYSRKHIEPYCDTNELDTYLDRADAFSRSLIDYKLAVIEISDADLSDAVNIFSRINSKGTDISFDWMVNALSYSNDFNFAYEIDSLKEDLTLYNFETISRNNLFRCYQSAFDDKLYIDQTNIEALATRDDFRDIVKDTTPCIKKAVEFLYKELNVVEYRLLPYNIQLVFIMTFFKYLPLPNKKQIDDLKRWFWITTYSNYFTIYSLSNQRQAYSTFISYLRGETDEIIYYDNRNHPFRTMPLPESIIMSAVRSKALILFELMHYREYSKNNPSTNGLSLHKLYPMMKNSPENIIPSYSTKESKKLMYYNNIWNSNYDEEFASKYFLPQCAVTTDIDSFLNYRKTMIINAERKFVQQLGLNYTEKERNNQ